MRGMVQDNEMRGVQECNANYFVDYRRGGSLRGSRTLFEALSAWQSMYKYGEKQRAPDM